jgi:hypothetical protein
MRQAIGVPPEGQLYHGVFPGGTRGNEDEVTPETLHSYQETVGRPVAWFYFSHNWFQGYDFPAETARWITECGSVPFIRLMLRSSPDLEEPGKEPKERVFTLAEINGGAFNTPLLAWGKAARDFGHPLIVEWGTEVNGAWFPWNAWWNGKPRGARAFQQAFRHIVHLIRDDAGARNTTWVFHVTAEDAPDPDDPNAGAPWNRLENYYPGDDVVDWLGVSVYGAQQPGDDACPAFAPAMDAVFPRLVELGGGAGRPIFLLEFGVTAGNSHCGPESRPPCTRPTGAARWANLALDALLVEQKWPALRGISWWNESWPNDDDDASDMRVQSVPCLEQVFRRHLASNPRILDRPILTFVDQ